MGLFVPDLPNPLVILSVDVKVCPNKRYPLELKVCVLLTEIVESAVDGSGMLTEAADNPEDKLGNDLAELLYTFL